MARIRRAKRPPTRRSRYFKVPARTRTASKRRYSPHFKKKITIKKTSIRFSRGQKITRSEVRKFRRKRVTGQPGVIKAMRDVARSVFERQGAGRYIFRATFRVHTAAGWQQRAFSMKRAKADDEEQFTKAWRQFRNLLSIYMHAYAEGEEVLFDGVDIEYTE